jgi:MEDS: MEthanogen/methylotroph, DcmR Sensory domain
MPLKLVETPTPPSHVVQFYGTHVLSLLRNVAYFLWKGLGPGGSALAIVREEHRIGIIRELQQLGVATTHLERKGIMTFLDSDETLLEILDDDHPDPDRFDFIVGEAARKALALSQDGTVRIYGEMAGTLWAEGNFSAALRLEQLGNRLLETPDHQIFCSYPIDIFSEEFRYDGLAGPLCSHTDVMPTNYGGDLDAALFGSAVDILGLEPGTLRREIQQRRRAEVADMPQAEAAILWLREHEPTKADKIIGQTLRILTSQKTV